MSRRGPLVRAVPLLQEKREDIRTWCREGVTPQELCVKLGVTMRQLERLMDESPELKDLIEMSKDIVDYRVEGSLYRQATGYFEESSETIIHPDGTQSTKLIHKYYPPNIAATQFWLKNRQPDRWRVNGGVVEQEEKPPLIINLTPPEDGDQSIPDSESGTS